MDDCFKDHPFVAFVDGQLEWLRELYNSKVGGEFFMEDFRIHGTGIIYLHLQYYKNQPNVGKYTIHLSDGHPKGNQNPHWNCKDAENVSCCFLVDACGYHPLWLLVKIYFHPCEKPLFTKHSWCTGALGSDSWPGAEKSVRRRLSVGEAIVGLPWNQQNTWKT